MEIINEDIVIAGAGIGGLATSLALHRYTKIILKKAIFLENIINFSFYRNLIIIEILYLRP